MLTDEKGRPAFSDEVRRQSNAVKNPPALKPTQTKKTTRTSKAARSK